MGLVRHIYPHENPYKSTHPWIGKYTKLVTQWIILLMEEILHHLGYINLVNKGINYISTGAGFLPSTVWVQHEACYTITSVGFGDITPQNVMERYICSVAWHHLSAFVRQASGMDPFGFVSGFVVLLTLLTTTTIKAEMEPTEFYFGWLFVVRPYIPIWTYTIH